MVYMCASVSGTILHIDEHQWFKMNLGSNQLVPDKQRTPEHNSNQKCFGSSELLQSICVTMEVQRLLRAMQHSTWLKAAWGVPRKDTMASLTTRTWKNIS